MSGHWTAPWDKIAATARKTRNWLRTYALWVRQGRPEFLPVVVKAGTITKCRHGYALVQCWHLDSRFQTRGPVDAEHMVDIFGAQYGVTRVSELDCCRACRGADTA